MQRLALPRIEVPEDVYTLYRDPAAIEERFKERTHKAGSQKLEDWDTFYQITWNYLKPAMERAELSSESTVLDIGSNFGYTCDLFETFAKSQQIQFTGLDISEEFTGHAQSIYPHQNFICGDVYELHRHVGRERYDFIFLNAMLNMLDDWSTAFETLTSHCKRHVFFGHIWLHLHERASCLKAFGKVTVPFYLFSVADFFDLIKPCKNHYVQFAGYDTIAETDGAGNKIAPNGPNCMLMHVLVEL